jgi:hypothetical protein
MPIVSTVISKRLRKKTFFVGILKANDEKSRIRSRIQIRIRNPFHGSKDLDPSQNVTEPEYWNRDQYSRSWILTPDPDFFQTGPRIHGSKCTQIPYLENKL